MITQSLFFALSLITRGVIGTTAVTHHQHHGQSPLDSLTITLQVSKGFDIAPLRYTLAPLPQTGNTSQEDTVQNSAQSHFHSNCPSMQELDIKGVMVYVEASNVNSFTGPGSVAYLSCDIEPTSSSPSTLLNKVLDSEPNAIVLYTKSGDWCWLEGSSGVGNIFTTVNASDAQRSILYLGEAMKLSTSVQVSIAGNPGYLHQSSEEEKGETGGGEKVLVVVSSIGGSVFGLFVLTTLVGVIRAYRHPERYGPRDEQDGHSSQTRIQGLTRAVLDTFPVVQFAHKGPSMAASTDPEVQLKEAHKNSTHGIVARLADPEPPACSICTENFAAQEDVRILPCKHEFHRSCIDPWLVKQSTKCPLCRCDFGPKDPSNRGQGNQSNREDELSERRETLMLRLLTVPG